MFTRFINHRSVIASLFSLVLVGAFAQSATPNMTTVIEPGKEKSGIKQIVHTFQLVEAKGTKRKVEVKTEEQRVDGGLFSKEFYLSGKKKKEKRIYSSSFFASSSYYETGVACTLERANEDSNEQRYFNLEGEYIARLVRPDGELVYRSYTSDLTTMQYAQYWRAKAPVDEHAEKVRQGAFTTPFEMNHKDYVLSAVFVPLSKDVKFNRWVILKDGTVDRVDYWNPLFSNELPWRSEKPGHLSYPLDLAAITKPSVRKTDCPL